MRPWSGGWGQPAMAQVGGRGEGCVPTSGHMGALGRPAGPGAGSCRTPTPGPQDTTLAPPQAACVRSKGPGQACPRPRFHSLTHLLQRHGQPSLATNDDHLGLDGALQGRGSRHGWSTARRTLKEEGFHAACASLCLLAWLAPTGSGPPPSTHLGKDHGDGLLAGRCHSHLQGHGPRAERWSGCWQTGWVKRQGEAQHGTC